MDFLKALEFYAAPTKSEYSSGETYETLDWFERNETPKPTLDDIEKAWEDYQKWKEKDAIVQQYKASIPNAEQQLQTILEEGLDVWADKMHEIRKRHPFDNNLKVAPKMSKRMDSLKTDLEAVNANLDKTNLNTAEVKQLMKDINNGLLAIKGFMSMIAEIHQAVKANGSLTPIDSQTKALD